jgi:hypothetical protein
VTFPQRFIAVMHGVVYYSRFAPSPVPVGSSEYVYRVMGMKRTTWTWWFVYDDSPGGCNLQIPLWAPFLLTAAPAGFLWRGEIIARRRRRAVAQGKCGGCGYDRDGLARDAKCPECGAGGSV